jgi:hypothetical protein
MEKKGLRKQTEVGNPNWLHLDFHELSSRHYDRSIFRILVTSSDIEFIIACDAISNFRGIDFGA